MSRWGQTHITRRNNCKADRANFSCCTGARFKYRRTVQIRLVILRRLWMSKNFCYKRNMMIVIYRLRSKSKICKIALFIVLIFLIFISYMPTCIYANDNKLIINPESISGENEKEGNVLAEYGFAVFTNDSMMSMHTIKSNKEKEQVQIISGLFNGEWKGIINYDKEVNNTLKSFSLFDKVDTGVEVESNKEINNLFIQKYKKIALCIILTCIMSTVVIRWNRKKYENNHNLRTRRY